MRRTLLSCTAVLALLALLPSSAAAGPSGPGTAASSAAAFSAPVLAAAGHYDELALVVDANKHIHIAATRQASVWYITDRTGTWTQRRAITAGTYTQYLHPLIALDERGRVYIAATRLRGSGVPANDGVFLTSDADRSPGTFATTPMRVSTPSVAAGGLKVTDGRIDLALERAYCCADPGTGPVWFKTRTGGDWSRGELSAGNRPTLRLTPDGRPLVASETDQGIRYAEGRERSGSFLQTLVPGTNKEDFNPQIGVGTSGRAFVAWWSVDANAEQYVVRQGSSWSDIREVSDTGSWPLVAFDVDTHDRPQFAIASGDVVRELRLQNGAWQVRRLASGAHVHDVALRRAFDGQVVVAWSTHKGVSVSRG